MAEKRKPRGDKLLKTIEKELGTPGLARKPDGGDQRGDTKLETLRKEAAKRAEK